MKAKLTGRYHVQHFNRDGELVGTYRFPNGIVDVGLNHILETEFNGGAAITTWYMGLVNNAGWSAFANGDTMASHAGWVESDDYSEGTRPEWTAGTATGRAITNAATVDFSIDATVTIKGIFITSGSGKLGTTGTLWSTAAFSSPVSANNGDTLKVTYTVSG